MTDLPRRFYLHRHDDPTGVSGTGVVATGVDFGPGAVVVRWLSDHPSVVVHDDIAAVLAVHGHDGGTEVRWIDDIQPLQTGRALVAWRASSPSPHWYDQYPGQMEIGDVLG